MKKLSIILLAVTFTSLFCMNASAQVKTVIGVIITDEAAWVKAADTWLASKDADFGQTTTLIANVANGDSAATHSIVLAFPDYASWQAHQDRVATSADFARYLQSTSGIATSVSESIYVHVTDNGKNWNTGDYIFTVGLQVSSGAAAFVASRKVLMNSALGKRAPGLLRLSLLRAGGGGGYYAAIYSAPTFAALNNYLDSYDEKNESWGNYQSKAGAVTTQGFGMGRVVKVWK